MAEVVDRGYVRAGLLGLLLLAFWLVGFLLMPIDTAAFWLNDWDYSESIYRWYSEGELMISDYPSTTLVTHLWWGNWWTALLGDAMLALRVGSMISATIVAVMLNGLARSYGLSKTLSFILIGAFLLNPLVVLYSQTFETGLSGCLIMLALCASLAMLSTSLTSPKPSLTTIVGLVMICGVLSAASYLLNQIYIIPLISFVLLNLFHGSIKSKLLVPISIAAIAIGPIYYYWNWIETVNGEPLGFSKPLTNFWLLMQTKIVLIKVVRILLTVSYHLWPLAIPAFCLLANFRWRLSAAVLGAVTFAVLNYVPMFERVRPYFAYSSSDGNLGYLRQIGGIQDQWASSFDWEAVRLGVSVFSFVTFAAACLWYVQQYRSQWKSRLLAIAVPNVYSICLLSLVMYMGWLIVVVDVYDHHFLPILGLAIVCCIPLLQWMQVSRLSTATSPGPTFVSRAWQLAAVAILLVAGTFTTLRTADILHVWDECWKLTVQLMDEGTFPQDFDMGMALYGSHVYRPTLMRYMQDRRIPLTALDPADRENILHAPDRRLYRFSTFDALEPNFAPRRIRTELTVIGYLDDYDLALVQ